jgi:ubiquinone/menaquinone biosynthesis C-methylase UbiE
MNLRISRRAGWIVLASVAVIVVVGAGAGSALHHLQQRNLPLRAARLAAALRIGPGSTVAEIGAGDGAMAVQMARIVGPGGAVVATELAEPQLDVIRRAARLAGVANLTVRLAGARDTNLDPGCCDAVYMQRVYHHLTDPAPVMASVARALKPGGRVGVLEFEPGWIANWSTPAGVPDRGGHGVPKRLLPAEMAAHGFQSTSPLEDFDSELYLGVFRRAPVPQQDRR